MKEFFVIISNALTYNGDVLLSIINFILLIITILPFVITNLRTKVSFWWIVLLCSVLLQAVLWFVVQAQGISIIWNALFGFLIIVFFRQKEKLLTKSKVLIFFSIGIAVLANIYFGLFFPLITAVAHVAAIVFGMLFSFARKVY